MKHRVQRVAPPTETPSSPSYADLLRRNFDESAWNTDGTLHQPDEPDESAFGYTPGEDAITPAERRRRDRE